MIKRRLQPASSLSEFAAAKPENRSQRFWGSWFLRLSIALALLPLPCHADGPRTITDMSGARVEIAQHPARLAELWFAHQALLILLKAADRIVVTVDSPSSQPWMYKVAPVLNKAISINGPVPNIETLVRHGVDTAFVFSNSPATGPLRNMNIPVIDGSFQDSDALIRAARLTADVLNTSAAHNALQLYEKSFNEIVGSVRTITDRLPAQARPRVLHIVSLHPLKIDGKKTIIDEWIRFAGGRNVAETITGNSKEVSLEQIAAWNPDIIIIAGHTEPFNPHAADGLWQSLVAVQRNRVYRNPTGVFPWDRYGVEFPLQVLWTAKILHPELFQNQDPKTAAIQFYRDFFDYPLTSEEADRILAGKLPEESSTH